MSDKPKYRWNKEFVTLINNNVCPYCEESLILKGITKQCQCSFYIIGACETLAFEKISQDAPIYYGDALASEICECGNTDFTEDFSRAETVCKKCGMVISGPPSYTSYRHISYDSFNNRKGALEYD
jgi:ribosomal protein L32